MSKKTIKLRRKVDADYDIETGEFTPAHYEPITEFEMPEISDEMKKAFQEALDEQSKQILKDAQERQKRWWYRNVGRGWWWGD